MIKLAPAVILVLLAALAHGDATVNNGSMEGQAIDHSDGKGLLLVPPGWLPVNINTGRGDRLSVEQSDRPDAGQCLRVKTFGSDAGVYQSLIPLEKGRTYLVSAWVKRISGRLTIEAYPAAWGPACMRVYDGESTGWTRLTVGLTPVDGGAHVYLVAAPEAEFLIDDVQIRPARLQVGKPELLPFDLGQTWQYLVSLTPTDAAELPLAVRVQVMAIDSPSGPRDVTIAAMEPTSALLDIPLNAAGEFYVQATDPATGEILGGSPTVVSPGSPWVVRFPHKDSLYASLGYRWPLRISLKNAAPGALGQLQATCAVTREDGSVAGEFQSVSTADALEIPIDGSELAHGLYRLRLMVQVEDGRQVFEAERPLRVLPPSENEVVCAPNGDTLVNGQRFFPIGLYWVLANPAHWKPGPDRKTEDMLDLRRAGFNTLHTYAFEHNDAPDTDENAQAYLDMARELGFMVMMGFRREWYQGAELNATAIEQRVTRLRDHPALLCWTLWDEPDCDPGNAPRVQAVYDIVNRLDPYHPAMPVFMTGGGRPFREAADINLFDCYPANGAAGILPGVFERTIAAIPDKPMWYVARAYQQGTSLPSEEEMFEYWRLALEADAKAIFWYSYGGDAKGWDSIRITPEHYASVKRAVRALADWVGAE